MDGALGGASGGALDGAIAGAMAGKVTSIGTGIGTGIGAGGPDAEAIRHRTAERFTLMLRVAKLVSSHGEYPCVIRDVSATGVRLRLFHALPAERHLALFLGNGDCYFIETVWDHAQGSANGLSGEAGFRFSAPIDVRAFMTESSKHPKRQVRLGIALPATLSIREFSAPVMIRDISQQGARIDSDRPLALDQHVRLKAHGLPEIFASVRWKAEASHGLVFQQSFRLDELAQLAWRVAEPAERAATAQLATAQLATAQLAAERQATAVTANRRAG